MKRLTILGLSLVFIFILAFTLQQQLLSSPKTESSLTSSQETASETDQSVSNQAISDNNEQSTIDATNNETDQNSTVADSNENNEATTELVTYHSNPDQTTQELPMIETTLETTTIAEMAQEKNLINTDLPETVIIDQNDQKYSLYRLLDRPTIINVWASWCPPCREEMPYFQKQYDLHHEDIQFIMLNATLSRPSETEEAAKEYLKEFNYTMPIYYDLGFNNQVKLETAILPYTIVIHADGSFDRYPGQMSEEQLIEIIDGLLAE
ncbi:TlpA family protein disulfide reductase [Globicatella sanguinis]